MYKLNNYFDRIFIINLEKRTDRKQHCEEQMKLHNFTAEFIDAIDGKDLKGNNYMTGPEQGCYLSHRKVWEIVLKENISNALIVEDDFEFHPDFNFLFPKMYEKIPSTYDLLYLGCNSKHQKSTFINGTTILAENVLALHAYSVSAEIIPTLLNLSMERQVDVSLAQIQAKNRCYAFQPPLVFQKAGYSDIQQSFQNYTFLK